MPLTPVEIKKCAKFINSLVEDKKHITEKRIKNLSMKLYKECKKLSEILINNRVKLVNPIQAALYILLNNANYKCSCGAHLPYKNWIIGFQDHCSSKCASSNIKVKIKRSNTCLSKYGVDAVQKVKSIRNKFKKSMLKNHGVEYSLLSEKLKNKTKNTNIKKYGFPHPMQNKLIYNKTVATFVRRYGVTHISQCREISERQQKSGFKLRALKINKRLFMVRGYEVEAIRFLVKVLKVKIKNIKITHAEGNPTIKWKDSTGKERVYFPDVYCKIKNNWYLIEVKSAYTAGLLINRELLSRLRKKARYSKKAGYKFKVIIVSSQRNLNNRVCAVIDNIENIENKNRKTIVQELKSLHPGKYQGL